MQWDEKLVLLISVDPLYIKQWPVISVQMDMPQKLK